MKKQNLLTGVLGVLFGTTLAFGAIGGIVNGAPEFLSAVDALNKVEAKAETATSGGDLTLLNVPKTEYEYDEPINISAIGSGKDWVGIYYPDASKSIYWTYIEGAVGSGVEFDITKTEANSGAPAVLPAGKYIIRLMPNDAGNTANASAWVEITIKPSQDLTTNSGGDLTLLSVPKSVYGYSEPINISATGSGKDWVGIYYPGSSKSLYWDYIEGGVGSGVTFDIRQTQKNKDAPAELPAGKYVIRLMPNDSSDINKTLAWVEIIIQAEEEVTPPPVEEETKKLTVSKTEYEYDEPILVTAVGSGKDWVGIYYPDSTKSIYWTYIDASAKNGVGSGVEFDIKQAANSTSGAPAELPAGKYIIRLMPNDSSDLAQAVESVEITIKESEEERPTSGGDLTRLNVPKTEYAYTEAITISAIGSGKDWVGIYTPDASASLYWTYIDTSANNGVGSGVEFDIREAANRNHNAPSELPAGEYIIRLMPNDSENISKAVAWIKITVKELQPGELKVPGKPISAEYELTDSASGYSEGELTVTVAGDEPAEDIVCYWADENGHLEDYTALAKFKITGETTVRKLPPYTLIPAGATKLLVYTSLKGVLSEECYEIELPEGAASDPLEDPWVEFQVVSDIHINEGDHEYNANYTQMLQDIVKTSPDSVGVFIVGDIADHGYANEWKTFAQLHASVESAPAYYLAIGNHDLYNGGYEAQINQFLNYTQLPEGGKASSCHYDFWLEGYHYVFLGNDAGPVGGRDTTLTPETLEWLDRTLAEDREEDIPTFLFLHQSIYNTIAGSLPGQGWDGVVDDNGLSEVLKKYPEVIMFNGHSHWTLDSEGCMYPRSEELPTIFNTASVAYLWTSYDLVGGESMEGSQGYYIQVYKDKVVVRGRDFTTGKWIASAQFVVEYTLPVDEEPEVGCTVISEMIAFISTLFTMFGAGMLLIKKQ